MIFHALWNELRTEAEHLMYQGFTGEGFLGNVQALGGQRLPRHEMERRARAQARERLEAQRKAGGSKYGPGHRLGGLFQPRTSTQEAVKQAAIRRAEVTKGCASDMDAGRRRALEQAQAQRNGFETKEQE